MGKLRYYFGTMSSMKSSTVLLRAHQFKSVGCNVILLKSSEDTRNPGVISSRALKETKPCKLFSKEDNLFDLVVEMINDRLKTLSEEELKFEAKKKTVVFVDESNLLTTDQVNHLWNLSKSYLHDIDIYVFGLKMTYKNTLFESAAELFARADSVEEIKSMCSNPMCNDKATTHLLYVNDIPVKNGDDVLIGDVVGDVRFESVCQSCWNLTHIAHDTLCEIFE